MSERERLGCHVAGFDGVPEQARKGRALSAAPPRIRAASWAATPVPPSLPRGPHDRGP
jgi:hypothetical protein